MSTERPPAPGLDLAALLRIRGGPLVESLERHLPGSREHAQATATYAFAASVGLDFERGRCEVAREAAALHQIGLIYVPVAVLRKPAERRSPEEAEVFGRRYEAGYRLARGAGIPEHACNWLLRAAERFDGAGPERLAGARIPIESRLIRAASTCRELLASAPRDGAHPPLRAAIEGLSLRAGDDLDPRVVAGLTEILERITSGA